jgi:hypothetical protein
MASSALQLISTQRATAGVELRRRCPRRHEQQLRHAEAVADARDARRVRGVRAVLKNNQQVAAPPRDQAVNFRAEARIEGESARLSRDERCSDAAAEHTGSAMQQQFVECRYAESCAEWAAAP